MSYWKRLSLDEMRELSQTLINLTDDPEFSELRRAFTAWIRHSLLPRALPGVEIPDVDELLEIKDMLAEKSYDWTRKWKLEGKLEGQLEGQAILLERLLIRKFDALPDGVAKRLHGATADQLETWSLNILDATTLDEVFTD